MHIDSDEAWIWCGCGASGPNVGIESTQELTTQRAANAWNKPERENEKLSKQLAKARWRIQATRMVSDQRTNKAKELLREYAQSFEIAEHIFGELDSALDPFGEVLDECENGHLCSIARLDTIQREILDGKAGAK